ncbi:MAG: F0F1 ATP synthase subunit gamma, partial [Acidimicrobiales bacterium]
PAYSDARPIAQRLIAAYLDGEVDQVEAIYNSYGSAISQVVRRETLLPLQRATVPGLLPGEEAAPSGGSRTTVPEYEPSAEGVLSSLVSDYVEISVYRALLESSASEHGARMTAMRQASDNAGELIRDLTLQMNRARQAEITQEIMEVVAGVEALG